MTDEINLPLTEKMACALEHALEELSKPNGTVFHLSNLHRSQLRLLSIALTAAQQAEESE